MGLAAGLGIAAEGLAAPLAQQGHRRQAGAESLGLGRGQGLVLEQGGGHGGVPGAGLLQQGQGPLPLALVKRHQGLLEQQVGGGGLAGPNLAAAEIIEVLLQAAERVVARKGLTQGWRQVGTGQHSQFQLAPFQVIGHRGPVKAGDQAVGPEQQADHHTEQGQQHLPARRVRPLPRVHRFAPTNRPILPRGVPIRWGSAVAKRPCP